MPTNEDREAEAIVEEQIEAHSQIAELLRHSTVRSNPTLRRQAEGAQRAIERANIRTCRRWFRRDTLGDLPPLAA